MAEPEIIHTPSTAGELPALWTWRRLDSVCEGIFDCPHSTPMLVSDGPYVARSQDIRSGVFRTEGAGRVSEDVYRERIARAEPRHGDLLYSREGTYFGIAAEVPFGVRVCLGQRMVLLRPNSSTDPRFLLYWLNSPSMAVHIHGYRDGTVAERLNLPMIRQLPVSVPPLNEQRAIAHILGTLDDKIELNRRMNETLEAIARALFKSWFVDFDPVRAKEEGRDTGLPPHVAELFPDRFEESELGEIPAGWWVVRFEEIASLSRDSVTPANYPDEVFDHYSIPAFDESRMPMNEGGSAILSNKTTVSDQCVLLSKLNPRIARVWLPNPDAARRSICSTEFLVLLARSGASREFLYCLVSNDSFLSEFATLVTGTSGSHQRVKPEGLMRMNVALPSTDVLEAFTAIVRPLLRRVQLGTLESSTLAALRDALLPKLISGELRVKDVQIPAEENFVC